MYLRDIPHHYTIVKVQELMGNKKHIRPSYCALPWLTDLWKRSGFQAVRNHRVVARLHARRIALMWYDFLIN